MSVCGIIIIFFLFYLPRFDAWLRDSSLFTVRARRASHCYQQCLHDSAPGSHPAPLIGLSRSPRRQTVRNGCGPVHSITFPGSPQCCLSFFLFFYKCHPSCSCIAPFRIEWNFNGSNPSEDIGCSPGVCADVVQLRPIYHQTPPNTQGSNVGDFPVLS